MHTDLFFELLRVRDEQSQLLLDLLFFFRRLTRFLFHFFLLETISSDCCFLLFESIDESIDELVRVTHGKQPVQLSLGDRREQRFHVFEKRFQLCESTR